MSQELTLNACQQIVDQWIQEIGVKYYQEMTNTVILMEEVGELARLMARVYGEQSFKRPEDAEKAPAQIGEEMADILFVLICLANQTGTDLETAFKESMAKKTKRDKERHQNNQKLK